MMSELRKLNKKVIDDVLKMVSVEFEEYEEDENFLIDKFWSSYELYLESNYKLFEK